VERQRRSIRGTAEQYLDDALSASRVVEYRDARIEPRSVVVKTHEMAPDLSGYRGWRFAVGRRKTLSKKAEPVVWATPSTIDLLYWAKAQEPAKLRRYLGGQGIGASGSSRYVLAALLTYRYEEMQLKKTESWPLSDVAMDHRLRRIEAIEKYKDLKGGMSDEEIIVAVNLDLQGYSTSSHTSSQERKEEGNMKDEEKGETPSEIRARLRRQAGEGEPASPVEDEEGLETEEVEEEGGTPGSEMEAVRAGKRKGRARESGDGGKGRSAPPTSKTTKAKGRTTPEAEHVDEKETGEMAKKSGKKAVKKTAAKKAGKKVVKAGAPGRVKYEGKIERDFPVGSKIKYVGTRVAEHTGKVGEVTGHKDANGLNIKFSDGSKGTATPGAVELVKKGSGAGEKK